jgi:DNA-directed RNA polymerase alpha subunit
MIIELEKNETITVKVLNVEVKISYNKDAIVEMRGTPIYDYKKVCLPLKPEILVDEKTLKLREVLKTPLEDLDLSVRVFNCLKAAKINSLSELVQYEQEDLMKKSRNFGPKSLSEIEQVLTERGLSFGMDLRSELCHTFEQN